MDKNGLRKAGVFFVFIMLFFALFFFSPMQKVMAVAQISGITPTSGFVGDTVTVTGAIDTQDGFFTIRWNQTLNVTASSNQAVGVNVHTSFTVPQTVGAPEPLGHNVTIELIDNLTGPSPAVNFTLFTKFDMSVTAPTAPRQIQEGSTVPIAVNVTGGEENRVYTANITVRNPANQNTSIPAPLSLTTSIGYGDVTKIYPTDFPGGHLNYTGKYVVTSNVTSLPLEFTVGLTDKLEYRRNETVQIQAAGYKPSEVAVVNITTGGSSLSGFPINVTADSSGLVKSSWRVPLNSTIGTYTVSMTNSTSSGTVKTPSDVQTFDVLGLVCRVRTINRAGEGVQNTLVEVHNATLPKTVLLQGSTNSTGWVRFNLDDGNYTFKGLYKNANVGIRANQVLTMDTDLEMQLDLVNFAARVETTASEVVPFVVVSLKYSFTTKDNTTMSETLSTQTNLTGIGELHNLFTNKTYIVEARRYDLLFVNTTLTIEPSSASLVNLELTLPTYRLNVHTSDSKNTPLTDVQIKVYDLASGVTTALQSAQTDNDGDASFLLPFGIYRLRAYRGDVFLDESIAELVEDQFDFTFSMTIINVDVTVSVTDYFGQPIGSALVEIKRKVNQDYVLVDSKSTGLGGSATFSLPLGGDSRISVFIAGRLVAAKTHFLSEATDQVRFSIGEYVAIAGYPIETSVFALLSFVIVLVVVFAFLSRKRLTQVFRRKSKS